MCVGGKKTVALQILRDTLGDVPIQGSHRKKPVCTAKTAENIHVFQL